MRFSPKKLALSLSLLAAVAALAVLPQTTLAASEELSLRAALAEVEAVAKAYPAGVPAAEIRALMFRVAPVVKAYTPPPPPVCPRVLGCQGYISGPTSPPQGAPRQAPAAVAALKGLMRDASSEAATLPSSRLEGIAAALRGLAAEN